MTAQAGFGFAPSLANPRKAAAIVRIADAGLFWMVEDGTGWRPLCPGFLAPVDAKLEAARKYPRAGLVRVVEASEVGR